MKILRLSFPERENWRQKKATKIFALAKILHCLGNQTVRDTTRLDSINRLIDGLIRLF